MEREKAAKASIDPFSLLNLLGVAGTAKVTQAEKFLNKERRCNALK